MNKTVQPKPMLATLWLALLSFTSLTTIYAADHHHHEAHIHGQLEMTLIAEANTIVVTIESPMMNLVGFEHQARNKDQQKALHATKLFFNHPEKWLSFKGAKCQLINADVEIGHNDPKSEHNDLDADYQYQCDRSRITAVDISLQQSFVRIDKIDLDWLVNGQAGMNTLNKGKSRVNFNEY